jgi:hypothetical protein
VNIHTVRAGIHATPKRFKSDDNMHYYASLQGVLITRGDQWRMTRAQQAPEMR